ncbi:MULTISPECIES: hypothetical protein [Burkholderia]|uniref:Uncharacterized protein n=1 Tax=Burkholderia aenigmatica TaxID=2015348 RepID=A0ABY6Y9U4_9BURK|nr:MULTISPECIES: hypothetical protein [Burkholderia]VWD45704.1 hypothetical protein BLA17378_08358 [Burkholderia aenigmatica]VWD54622.1 hypothetical protein BLA18628_06422 [Burkholderia aenigmatica]
MDLTPDVRGVSFPVSNGPSLGEARPIRLTVMQNFQVSRQECRLNYECAVFAEQGSIKDYRAQSVEVAAAAWAASSLQQQGDNQMSNVPK